MTGIALLMCVAGMPDWANALPVYAYSKNEIFNFSMQTETASNPKVLLYNSSHSASFAGFGTSSRPQDNESGFNNLSQSAVGPGGSPTEDFFAPYGRQGTGYARADTGVGLHVL